MLFNLPNTLTWLRILAIPLVIVCFLVGVRHPAGAGFPLAGILFGVASITDSLDGYLARRLGQTTRLGAFLDPVADKLIVAAALVLIVSRDDSFIVVASGIVIIGREIAVSALREWMAELGHQRPGQVQDDPADARAIADALPASDHRSAGLPARRVAHGQRRTADAVFDAGVPAGRLAVPRGPRLSAPRRRSPRCEPVRAVIAARGAAAHPSLKNARHRVDTSRKSHPTWLRAAYGGTR
jgi:phosphatidylglycerophosphate synthase